MLFACKISLLLLPDWIPLILEEDVRGLQDKMRQLFSESFGDYQNHDLRWILNKHRLPSSETMIHYWKSQAERITRRFNPVSGIILSKKKCRRSMKQFKVLDRNLSSSSTLFIRSFGWNR